MMKSKTLFETSRTDTDIIIFSEITKHTPKDAEPTYNQSVRECVMYVSERDDYGNSLPTSRKIWLNCDDIINLANKIESMRDADVKASDYIESDDLPF